MLQKDIHDQISVYTKESQKTPHSAVSLYAQTPYRTTKSSAQPTSGTMYFAFAGQRTSKTETSGRCGLPSRKAIAFCLGVGCDVRFETFRAFHLIERAANLILAARSHAHESSSVVGDLSTASVSLVRNPSVRRRDFIACLPGTQSRFHSDDFGSD